MSKKKKTNTMTHQDKQDVLAKIDYEGGFDYFRFGSSFPEYTDPEFRRLVEAFQTAYDGLSDFLGELEVSEEEDY